MNIPQMGARLLSVNGGSTRRLCAPGALPAPSVLPPPFVACSDERRGQDTENKERVSRFRPHFNAANFGIGTLAQSHNWFGASPPTARGLSPKLRAAIAAGTGFGMQDDFPLALHTWTIDTTPLPIALEAARRWRRSCKRAGSRSASSAPSMAGSSRGPRSSAGSSPSCASPKNIAGVERLARDIAHTEKEIAHYLDRLAIIDETWPRGSTIIRYIAKTSARQ